VEISAEIIPVYEITSVTDGVGCSGDEVLLTTAGAPENGFYRWYSTFDAAEPVPDQIQSTLTTDALVATTSYFVTVVNDLGCESSSRKEVFARIGEIFEIESLSSESVCPNNSVTIVATGAPDDGSYRWYDKDQNLIEETGASFTTTQLMETSNYFVSIVNTEGCESQRVLAVAEVSNESLDIEAIGGYTCGTGEVQLTASGAPENGFYRWFDIEGNMIEGVNGSEYSIPDISESTVYGVQSVSDQGCTSLMIEVIAEYRESPEEPVIEQESDFLITSSLADNYQWFKDNVPIEGERGSVLLHGYDAGAYSVQVEVGGCTMMSEIFLVTAIGELLNQQEIGIYPNPAEDFIRLDAGHLQGVKFTLIIHDMNGKIIYREDVDIISGKLDKKLDIKQYNSGVYFVKLTDGEYVYTGKFVKK